MFLRFIRQFHVALLLAAALTVQAQVDQRLPRNFSLQVNGQVRYAITRLPAEHILVRIEGSTGGSVSEVTTDRSGRFSFNGLGATQYTVTVHVPGYLDEARSVNLVTQATEYLDIELRASSGKIPNTNSDPGPIRSLVIDASVPFEARNELEKARTILYGQKRADNAEAIGHIENAIKIYPGYVEAEILLGLTFMDRKEWEKAETAFRSAIGIDARASTAYIALGEVLRRQKKYSEAEDILGQGLKLNPGLAEGHLTLAKVYWEEAPSSKDEEAFRKRAEGSWKEVGVALKLDPKLGEAHLLAGNLLLRANRVNDALVHFEEYLALEPNGEFAEQTKAVLKKIRASSSSTTKKP